MKNLTTIFNFLIYPFLFLIRFSLSSNQGSDSTSRELARKRYFIFPNQRSKRKNPFLFQSLLLLSTLLPLQLNAAVDVCPGNTLNNLNNASSDETQTVNATLPAYTIYYYTFTPTVAGKIQVDSSTNKSYNSLFIKDGCGANLWSATNNSNNKSSPEINVVANQQIVIAFERRWNSTINVELDFTFTVADPIESCPGVVIPNLNGTTTTATDSFSNVTVPASTTYYYYFTPTVPGTIQTNSAANKYSNSLFIKDGCGANLWSNTTNTNNKSSPEIPVVANQQIVIAFERRFTTSLTLNIDFTFTAITPEPPTMADIPDQTAVVGTAFAPLDISGYVTEPDGDTITYSATGLPDGLNIDTTTGVISGTPVTAVGSPYSVTVTATDVDGSDSATFNITVTDVEVSAVDDYFTTTANTTLTANVFGNDIGTGYSIVAADASSLQGIITNYDANTGAFTFEPAADFVGTTSFTYTISNDGGTTTSTATVQIVVTTIPIVATDDSYNTNPGVSVRDNLLDNDEGVGIEYTSITTPPSLGSVTVQATGDFVYTPNSGVEGTDTFTYLITDDLGNTDEATVTIYIGIEYSSGDTLDFELINPDFSRNVIGNYKIAGNTVLCLTEKRTGYGGTCTNDEWHTSNNYVSKYLDIDNDGGTWNSTSSYMNFDAPYEPARGIIWAGLFWGGRISSSNNYPIRYAVENGSDSFSTIEVGDGGNVDALDVRTTGATNIKLKIDNGDYADVLSSTFHTSGQTYAAFADVSSVIQSANLTTGKHVFTVANLTTMEGRESSPGAFGGWSLVVIYGEGYEFGKPRNISIYNGFIDIGNDSDPIEISGFKLPETGDVSAQLSVFSGEGEYLYGKNTNSNNQDWMKISDQEDSGYDYMPGKTAGTHLGNRDNMFDATLDNILRDSVAGEFNDLSNNNVGVDIDNYDVSDLMTGYRANNPDLSSVYIQMYSNNDYITPSMMAFSAELYVPELCYDYTLDIDGYVLSSVNNEIITPFGDYGEPLTSVLYLKSLEGDIDLSNVNINYYIRDSSQLSYNDCTTEISETGEYNYNDACLYTHDASLAGFDMYIGTGKTASHGGTISAFEDRYIKFESDFHTSSVNTSFEFSVDYTVDYGSGAVPLHKIFTPADLCAPTSDGFLPEMGYFNITDITNDIDEWNLYTQVSKRPFNLRLYAYEFDAGEYLTPIGHDLNLSLEVEVIRADNFNRDANTACNDEHSALTDVAPKFIHFSDGDGRYIDFGYDADDINLAYRSAAMRVWYLTDVGNNGILVDNHNCTRENQTECVALYTSEYTGDTSCTNECRAIASSGNCYDCLRSNYGRKVCSRDNFAIRPESFITQIYDSNQSNDTRDPSNHIANSIVTASEFSLISGYNYRFDINATNHVNDSATPRYIQHFDPGSPTHHIRMNWWPDGHTVTGCNDVEDKNITLNIFNGSTINTVTHYTYTDAVDQIGKYRFEVYDQNWTSADWNPSEMLHHQAGSTYAGYYKTGTDCLENSDLVQSVDVYDRQGCVISSVHTNPDTGTEYKYLYAQYYPYVFDVSGLTLGARPANNSSDNTFVYINTLDRTLYPNSIDENMSFNIQGTFRAAGYTGEVVSNFVDNCYAENVDMTLQHAYLSDVPTNGTHNLRADLIDHNTTDTSLTYPNADVSDRRRIEFDNTLTKNVTTGLTVTQNNNLFVKDMQGAITMDLGFNFDRTNNQLLNPRKINLSDFNITYATQPAPVYVDLKTGHQIFGNRNIDQNITFLYARAKPGKIFYDDVTDASIVTPISVVVYCDLGYTECQNRGIMALVAQTNEANWWKSWDHDNQGTQDGNIVFGLGTPTEGSGTPTISATSATIISEGEDKTISVGRGPSPTLPLTVPINFVVNDPANPPAPLNYTDRWLIYNPESATAIPSPFYRVRFIGSSGWAGQGDTGHVVGGAANTKKNKRLEW